MGTPDSRAGLRPHRLGAAIAAVLSQTFDRHSNSECGFLFRGLPTLISHCLLAGSVLPSLFVLACFQVVEIRVRGRAQEGGDFIVFNRQLLSVDELILE